MEFIGKCQNGLIIVITALLSIPLTVGPFASVNDIVSSSAPFLSAYPRLVPPVQVGDDINISTILKNPTGEDSQINVVIEARNSDGTSEVSDWMNMIISANETEYWTGVGWVPTHSDKYQLRTFVITDFGEDSMVMSEVEVSYVDVLS